VIIEYAGVADRWTGWGVVHEVRAWWSANQDSQGAVKRAAVAAVLAEVGSTDRAEFASWDMSTYSTPQLNAMVRVRVLTAEEWARRKELRSRRCTRCDKCGCDHPGQLVTIDGVSTALALCFGCWHPIRERCKVLHWIKANGKLQV
jgi:hypothetical protein